jgi:peptidoglycan/LPS O-acetylase OafA/YrhL
LTSRFAFLDIVRGVAIFAVVATHTAALVLSSAPHNALTELLGSTFASFRYGVELFFLLSGFLIGWIYDKSGNRKTFLLMRFFRLWPLWAMFTVIWLLYRLSNSHQEMPKTWSEAIANLAFLGWATPGSDNSFLGGQWSIQVEVYCYLIFSALKGRSTRAVLIATTSLNLIGLVNNGLLKPIQPELAAPLSNLAVWSGFSFFALGLLISRLMRSESIVLGLDTMFLPKFSKISGILALASTLISPAYYGSPIEALGFVTGSLAAALVISKGKYSADLFRILGRYSYSIFFSHFFVLIAVEFLLPKSIVSTPIAAITLFGSTVIVLTICTGIARATMWAIEGPALRLGKRLSLLVSSGGQRTIA